MAPEQTEGTTTETGSVGTPIQPVTPASPPASPQPTASPYRREDVYAPDGKRWADKFHGVDGQAKQAREAVETERAGYLEQIQGLEGNTVAAQSAIQDLTGQVTGLNEQLVQLPALQVEIDKLTKAAALAEKYRMLAEHPDLLQIQVEEEVPGGEGEEPTTVTYNPLLRLVETSTLEGDELRTEMQRFSKFYAAQSGQTQQKPASPGQPLLPPSPQPAGDVDTVEYWKGKAMEVQERINAGDMSQEARTEFRENWAKVRELEAAAATS